jgi:hypothetical protein
VDHVAAAGVAEYPGVHIASACRPRAVGLNTVNAWIGQYAIRKPDACDADADAECEPDAETLHHTNSGRNDATHTNTDGPFNSIANTNADSNSNPNAITDSNPNAITNSNPNADSDSNPDPNPGSSAPDVQPCVRHRDGERGVDQLDR